MTAADHCDTPLNAAQIAAFWSDFSRQRRGILAFARTEGIRSRMAGFYAKDPVYAAQLAAAHAPALEAEVALACDPAWREFLDIYGAIHHRLATQETA